MQRLSQPRTTPRPYPTIQAATWRARPEQDWNRPRHDLTLTRPQPAARRVLTMPFHSHRLQAPIEPAGVTPVLSNMSSDGGGTVESSLARCAPLRCFTSCTEAQSDHARARRRHDLPPRLARADTPLESHLPRVVCATGRGSMSAGGIDPCVLRALSTARMMGQPSSGAPSSRR